LIRYRNAVGTVKKPAGASCGCGFAASRKQREAARDSSKTSEGGIVAIKRSHSGSRVLAVLEAIASHQPIGVSALARLLDEDKSAMQRTLMTLADEGWIRAVRELPVRWEVTARILAVANAAQGNNDLRQRARPFLEKLRDDSGETVLLVLPDQQNFVIADVAESREILRLVPSIGDVVSARNTATG
jgi:IclR family acetate operon transcriptional repressor